MTNLNAIMWIFENDDVIRVERYITLTMPLTKEILRDKNNTEILVMTAFSEKIHDRVARFSHKIVDYH